MKGVSSMRRHILGPALAALSLLMTGEIALSAPACTALPSRTLMPAEATPQPVQIDEWQKREEQISKQVAGKDLSSTRLVFIGDSITQSWDPLLWSQFWGEYHPLNLGLWGDLTQGVLWRLKNGQWSPSLHPKVVVILIGTNNANWHSRPEDTALGVAEIVRFVRDHSSTSKVLLLGLLPRGADASAPERSVNAQVNRLIQRCADGQRVFYAEPGRAMMAADGKISNQVLFDYLHPTMIGYGILGGVIQAQVRTMMDK